MIWGCCKAITFSTEAVLQRCDVRILWPFDFWHAIASSESYSAVEEPVPTLFNESASTKDLYKINSPFSFSLDSHKLHYESGLKTTSWNAELIQEGIYLTAQMCALINKFLLPSMTEICLRTPKQFLDAIASPSSYPCGWVGEWVSQWLIVSDFLSLSAIVDN